MEGRLIQDLIDEAVCKAFGDYDTSQAFDDLVIGILPSRRRAAVTLTFPGGPLQILFNHAVKALEEMTAPSGYGVVYQRQNGRELVFLLGIDGNEKGICAFELKRGTGDPRSDLIPIPEMRIDPDCAPVEALEWGGSRRRVDVAVRDYVMS
jgi:hypothetical protein